MLVALLHLPSCSTKGLFESISKERAALEAEARVLAAKDRETVKLDWKRARKMVLDDNIELGRTASRLEEIKRQRREQWREWLPRPRVYFSLQSQLRDISDLEFNDINKSLYAPLVIPNPTTLRAKTYDYALREVQAEDTYEMARRKKVIELYRLYAQWELMETRIEASHRGKGIEDEINQLLRSREQDFNDRQEKAKYWVRLARLTNMPGRNIIPLPETLPEIDYSKRIDHLVPGENYGKMAYRLSSYEIVAAVMRSKGIRLSNWGTANVSTGFPPIYASARDGDEWIDGTDEISLFGSVGKSFDLTGRVAASIESAEEQVTFMRESLKHQMDQEDRDWQRLKERYKSLMLSLSLIEGRLERAMAAKEGDVTQDWSEVRNLFTQLRGLRRAKLWLDMELWLWDDAAWD